MNDAAPRGTIAEGYLPDLSALSIEHRATFRLGQIVRLSVSMERAARDVHARLQGVPASLLKDGPRGFGALIADVGSRLTEERFPLLEHASAALADVKQVYTERNRFVHDSLDWAFNGQWQRSSIESLLHPQFRSVVNEDILRDQVMALVRAEHRLLALDVLIVRWQLGDRIDVEVAHPANWERWPSVLAGHFELTPGGGVRIVGSL